MPTIDALVQCPVYDSFRVSQLAGMFDVALSKKAERRFSVEVPGPDEDWQVGVIVGPSGSGKSTIARHAFGECLHEGEKWPEKKAVIDCFGEHSVRDISQALSSVGFSSPPSWVKPYRVLSNGEKFRCELAQVLMSDSPLVAFDEFTSVVDRTVAKIGSAAISKAIRRQQPRKFVAVTCHYDVAEWLEADWVLDMGTAQLARGRLRRPDIRLEVFRCDREAWRVFGPHHYMNNKINRQVRCFIATWEQEPVAMVAVLNSWGFPGYHRISRVVVLPDYQGIGIGRKILASISQQLIDEGAKHVGITTGQPAMIASLSKSPEWSCQAINTTGCKQAGGYSLVNGQKVFAKRGVNSHSLGRSVVRFRFRPRTNPVDQPQRKPRPAWLNPKPKRSDRTHLKSKRPADPNVALTDGNPPD